MYSKSRFVIRHNAALHLREYAIRKYPNELDEDLITMIEDLIERRRGKRYDSRGKEDS